ncbi:MAG: hypothetical protein R2856_29655 [Caldilineaceae bacterium]
MQQARRPEQRPLVDGRSREAPRARPDPRIAPAAAWKARIWIAQGRLADARRWAQAQTLSAEDELSYLREFEHITLARLLLAEDEIDGALTLLDRLLHGRTGSRMGSVLEIEVLQALAHHAQDDVDAALSAFTRALDIAASEGYVRVFVDEGPRLRAAVRGHGTGITSPHIVTLRAAFDGASSAQTADRPVTQPTPVSNEQPLIEPLSERELEVLHLIAQDYLTTRSANGSSWR